jgi:NADPH:quinone reductase-like Zn-dependent oxidoreductase
MRSISVTQSEALVPNEKIVKFISKLDGYPISYGLIEMDAPIFDSEVKENFVLVQKKAISLNYRDKALVMMVQYQLNALQPDPNKFYPIGSEFSGVVIKIGKSVKSLFVGDRVIGNYSYPESGDKNLTGGVASNSCSKEFEIFHEKKLFKIPDSMSFEVAAAFTIGAQTSYSMIDKLSIEPNTSILVTAGNSNTSLFTIQSLNHKEGLRICVLVRSEQAKEDLHNLGLKFDAVFVVDDTENNFILNSEIKDYTSTNGLFDYVIDPFIDYNLTRVISVMSMNSKYVSCGISQQIGKEKPVNITPLNLATIIMKNITIIGNCLGSTEHLEKALLDYEKGKLKVHLHKTIENDVKLFFEESFCNKRKLGKVIFNY